jgi:succinate-acetate transporter protein
MGVLIFMYTICALRTNIVFFVIFLLLDIAVFLLTGAYWKAAHGDMAAYDRLMTVSPTLSLYMLFQFGVK